MYFYSFSTRGFYHQDLHGSAMPPDVVEITPESYADLLAGQSAGLRIVPAIDGAPSLAEPLPLTAEQVQATFVAAIQKRLDDFARTRNYDSILSACTYATSTVPKFAAEGQAAVDLRDQTWAAAYTILDDVLANRRDMPASIADIEYDLPALEWPA